MIECVVTTLLLGFSFCVRFRYSGTQRNGFWRVPLAAERKSAAFRLVSGRDMKTLVKVKTEATLCIFRDPYIFDGFDLGSRSDNFRPSTGATRQSSAFCCKYTWLPAERFWDRSAGDLSGTVSEPFRCQRNGPRQIKKPRICREIWLNSDQR